GENREADEQDVADGVQLVEDLPGVAGPLGSVEQGLGVGPGQVGRLFVEHGRVEGDVFTRGAGLGVGHAAPPTWWPLAGSSAIAESASRRRSSSESERASTLPATETARSAALVRISTRAWSRAVAMSRSARWRAASDSAWALRVISSKC